MRSSPLPVVSIRRSVVDANDAAVVTEYKSKRRGCQELNY